MAKQGKLRIKIEFEDEFGQITGQEELIDLSKEELEDLDSCEQHLLDGTYQAMRKVLSAHMSEVSKKKVDGGK
jgi:hypothetical protein